MELMFLSKIDYVQLSTNAALRRQFPQVSVLCMLLLLQLPLYKCLRNDYSIRIRGVYSGWLGRGNMGDEVVLDIFAHLLEETLRRQTSTQDYNTPRVFLDNQVGGVLQVDGRGQPQKITRPALSVTAADFGVLGGGSLLEPTRTVWSDFCLKARIGGPPSLPLYIHASGTQLEPSNPPNFDSLHCIKQPAFGGLRGRLTAAMLKQMMAAWARDNKNVDTARVYASLPVISDSGILAGRIFPRTTSALVEAVDRAAAATSAGVLCLSGMPHGLDSVQLIRTWSSNYVVVLMPVDHITMVRQREILRGLSSSNPSITSRMFLNLDVTSYGVWLALLDRCTIMLTSRLHAMILSAATQTPFRVFAELRRSQKKMVDFVQQTFGEDLESFKVKPNFSGNIKEVDELLAEGASAAWRARYNATYEQRAITAAYKAHLDSMGSFVGHLLSKRDLRRVRDIRLEVRRFWDSATITIGMR